MTWDWHGHRRGRRPAGAAWARSYVLVLLGADWLVAFLVGLIALFARFGLADLSRGYLLSTLAFPFVWVGALTVGRGYERRLLGAGGEEYRRVFDAAVRLFAGVAIGSVAVKADVARGYLAVLFPLAAVLTLAGRYGARQGVYRLRRRGRCHDKVVVVGTRHSVARLLRRFASAPLSGFDVIGACLADEASRRGCAVPVLGDPAEAARIARRVGADVVALTDHADLDAGYLRRLSWSLEGSGVRILVESALDDIAQPRVHLRPVAGLLLLQVEQLQLHGVRRVVKELLDRAIALLGLLVLSPMFLLTALLVRLTSPGPALFRQVRVGVNGSAFTMLKFRSMYLDAERELPSVPGPQAADSLLYKHPRDPRITPVGRWLRRFSLDELPQLVNVLRGDMSLVGPRPPLPAEVGRYGGDVPRRLLVKPGLTGQWQVSGRSDLSWADSVRLDLAYVENWSLTLDLLILVRTVGAVLARRGAY